jgi:hypothetical protein
MIGEMKAGTMELEGEVAMEMPRGDIREGVLEATGIFVVTVSSAEEAGEPKSMATHWRRMLI